jgi:hypothetical protein
MQPMPSTPQVLSLPREDQEQLKRAEQILTEFERGAQVRKTPSWPEVGPTSAFYSCVPTGMHGPTCIFWGNLTPSSVQLREQPVETPMFWCIPDPRDSLKRVLKIVTRLAPGGKVIDAPSCIFP